MFYQQQGKEEESSIIDSAMRRQGFHLSEKLKEISVQRGWGRDAADIAVMVSFGGNVDRRSVLALLRTRKLTTLRTLVRIFAQVDHGICLRFEPLTAGFKQPNIVGFFTSEGLEQKLAEYLQYLRMHTEKQVCRRIAVSASEDGASCPTIRTLNQIAAHLGYRLVISTMSY